MKRLILLPILLILLIAGCKKQTSQPSTPFTMADFPLTVGNYWVYSRYDATPNVRDTVTLSLISKYVIGDTTKYIFTQNSPSRIDTSVLAAYRDTICIISATGEMPFQYISVYPLINNSYWSDSTYTCSLTNPLMVNNSTYNNIYAIHHSALLCLDVCSMSDTYLVKGIGIVRYNQNTSTATFHINNLATTHYQWDLLSYHII